MLDATVRLLATEGVARTSMDRVAAAAGVSKVTVYSRWAGKNELIGAALPLLRLGRVPEPVAAVRARARRLLVFSEPMSSVEGWTRSRSPVHGARIEI